MRFPGPGLFVRKYYGYILLIILAISICVLAYFNEVSEGGADNYWHYYFSKYAPQKPEFFLHHWGKPFFILLSTPFSHFGFYPLVIFNVVCGVLSAWVAFEWCKKLNFNYSFLSIPLIIFTPIYFLTIQSALTEPLFSLLLILTAYLLFYEKYFAGCLLASFLMYSRSEGIFIIIIFASYLIIDKQYKYIPLLFAAFFIYSFAGYFTGHDFFWFFTENPYKETSPYGSGTWMHFIENYRLIFGKAFTKIFIIGLIILIGQIIRKNEYFFWRNRDIHFKIFYLSFLPAAAFFLFHVYAWAEGKHGSAGIYRVMASIVPLASVTAMTAIDFIKKINIRAVRISLLIYILFFIIKYNFKYYGYPAKAYDSEKAELLASEWFKNYRETNSTIFYAHPGIIFYCDYNPFDESNKECFGFEDEAKRGIAGKFYYIWDSDFSEFSCHNKLEDLEQRPEMKKIKTFREGKFKLVFFESK